MKISPIKISMLRQWLNEDRIDDPKKMITNSDIEYWLGIIDRETFRLDNVNVMDGTTWMGLQ